MEQTVLISLTTQVPAMGDFSHRMIQSGGDLKDYPVQPPSQSLTSHNFLTVIPTVKAFQHISTHFNL